MTEMRLFICDGCDEKRTTSLSGPAISGEDWHAVSLHWSGLSGYPTNLKDGGYEVHLCKMCSARFKDRIEFPRLWPRVAKSEAAS